MNRLNLEEIELLDRRIGKAKEAARRLYKNDYTDNYSGKNKRAADYKVIRQTINWLLDKKTLFSGRVAVPMPEAKIKELKIDGSIEDYHKYEAALSSASKTNLLRTPNYCEKCGEWKQNFQWTSYGLTCLKCANQKGA